MSLIDLYIGGEPPSGDPTEWDRVPAEYVVQRVSSFVQTELSVPIPENFEPGDKIYIVIQPVV